MLSTQLTRTLNNKSCNRRLWQWVNIIFNTVDEDRRRALGPDRTCAEWLLRNGGKVKWKGSDELLADYNQLPPESMKLRIAEVDASRSSIMHYGFPHFEGCKYIEKIILHDCAYLQDEALGMMMPLQNQLKYLQVSKCGNITQAGLLELNNLTKLQTLVLFDLPYVKSKETVVADLKSKLPNCSITFN